MLQLAKVILNGLDDKIYNVSDEFDISNISPYHKHHKEGNLHKIFPMKGAVQVNFVSEKLKKIISQDSYESHDSSIHKHYKELCNDYMKMLLILFDMGLECKEDSLSILHYRQISPVTKKLRSQNIKQFIANI